VHSKESLAPIPGLGATERKRIGQESLHRERNLGRVFEATSDKRPKQRLGKAVTCTFREGIELIPGDELNT